MLQIIIIASFLVGLGLLAAAGIILEPKRSKRDK